jgi:hypothetical protein
MVVTPGDEIGLRAPSEVARLCGPRFVPDPDVTLPGQPVVYRRPTQFFVWHDDPERWIPATEDEAASWKAAADAYVDALLGAEREIMAAHGVLVDFQSATSIDYTLPTGRPTYPRTVRGRLARRWAAARRRWDERSEASRAALAAEAEERERELVRRSSEAQRRYAARVVAATEAYRPIAELVSQRLAEKAARIERDRLEAEAITAREEEVAARRVWGYELVERDGVPTARAFRHDVAPDGPRRDRPAETAPGPAPKALTGTALKKALLNLPDEPAIEWDPAAERATVAELCPPADPERAFENWWTHLPAYRRTRARGTGATSRHTHASTHHTSHGAHLSGGWSGGVHT